MIKLSMIDYFNLPITIVTCTVITVTVVRVFYSIVKMAKCLPDHECSTTKVTMAYRILERALLTCDSEGVNVGYCRRSDFVPHFK